MYLIIKEDKTDPLDPTRMLLRDKTILQNAFSELFRKSGLGNATRNILRCAGGDEIMVLLDEIKTQIIKKGIITLIGYSGSEFVLTDKNIKPDSTGNPSLFISETTSFISLLQQFITQSYRYLSETDSLVRKTIHKIQSNKDIVIYASKYDSDLFLYDGTINESGEFIEKTTTRLLNKAIQMVELPDFILPASSLKATELQQELFKLLETELKIGWTIPSDGIDGFYLTSSINIDKLVRYLMMTNRGFLKANYGDMILPESPTYKIIRFIEDIGNNISSKHGAIPEEARIGDVLSVEEGDVLKDDIPKIIEDGIKELIISYVKGAGDYELQSYISIGGLRPKLETLY